MKLCGTQSGHLGAVKKNDRRLTVWQQALAVVLAAGVLGACASSAGGWRQPVKNEALTRADFAACKTRAEEATLELRRTDRSGYGSMGSSRPGPFNPRGDNTMAIAVRSDTSTLYEALVANCMTQKGYARAE